MNNAHISNRSANETLRRYIVFTFGLMLSALGVVLLTRSALGTSPISSLPFVMSLHTPLSMGTFTALLNVALIIGILGLLGRKRWHDNRMNLLMQLPVSVLFGVFIDFFMLLTSGMSPAAYWLCIATLTTGCLVMGAGICLQVEADVTMNSGEYFVKVLANRLDHNFGSIKIFFDLTLVSLAAAASWLMAGRIDGLREGTLIAATLTGPAVKLIAPYMSPIRHFIAGTRMAQSRIDSDGRGDLQRNS